jgi:hypothetical protein
VSASSAGTGERSGERTRTLFSSIVVANLARSSSVRLYSNVRGAAVGDGGLARTFANAVLSWLRVWYVQNDGSFWRKAMSSHTVCVAVSFLSSMAWRFASRPT